MSGYDLVSLGPLGEQGLRQAGLRGRGLNHSRTPGRWSARWSRGSVRLLRRRTFSSSVPPRKLKY